VKEFLSREGRAYVERNVDDDPSAYDELLARGWRSVPVTVVGDTSVRGWDEPAIEAALARLDRRGDTNPNTNPNTNTDTK
jgi:hypothetical protein